MPDRQDAEPKLGVGVSRRLDAKRVCPIPRLEESVVEYSCCPAEPCH